MTRPHHHLFLLLGLGVSCSALAQVAALPVPKASLAVDAKGTGDPYPRADALVRRNVSALMERDTGKLQAWNPGDGIYGMWSDGDSTNPPPELEKQLRDTFERCVPLDHAIMPRGFQWSGDVHDFVFSPQAMQATLALQGALFAPFGSTTWKILRYSSYLTIKGRKTRLQLYTRLMWFVTTATPTQLRKAVIKMSADYGYRPVDEALRKSSGWLAGDSVTMLSQQVTPHVNTFALVTADSLGGEDAFDQQAAPKPPGHPAKPWSLNCLVTDDFAKDWLSKAKPGSTERWRVKDIYVGGVAQVAVLPLGEETEPYTMAHVDARLARERNLQPEQVAALRKAEQEELTKEAYRDSPKSRARLAEIAALQDKAADVTDQLRRGGYVEKWASMMKDITHRLGMNIDNKIDAMAIWIDERFQQTIQGLRRAARQIRDFLSSL